MHALWSEAADPSADPRTSAFRLKCPGFLDAWLLGDAHTPHGVRRLGGLPEELSNSQVGKLGQTVSRDRDLNG